MKKIAFLLAAFLLVGVSAKAQIYSMLATTGNASDTVSNTGTETLTKMVNGTFTETTIQVVVTKISGTVAGNCILQGSIDGVNYVNLNHLGQPAANDTCTNTDVTTNSFIWTLGTSKYLYYRVKVTGSGTMSARITAKIMVRR